MSVEKKVKVELVTPQGNSEKKTLGEVITQHWEQKERTERALKSLGLFWGIAIFCIIIPIAHFILVPSFLLAGPIVAYFTYSQSDIIQGGSGPCPNCQKPFKVARMKIKWPLNDVCSECHAAVKIYSIE
jgi:hypothetical protein